MGRQVQSAANPALDPDSIAWAPQPGPQTALLECPVEDLLFGGARGGGKTDGLLGDWLSHSNQWGRHARGVLFRRTYGELEEVEARAHEIFPVLGAKWNVGKRTWWFKNRSRLKLRYLERDAHAARYQGHSYTWAGVDEAGNFPTPGPIDMIRATLRSRHGVHCVMRASANPGGPGHGWLQARYIKGRPAMVPFFDEQARTWRVYIPSRLEDNALLMANDPGYKDRLRGAGPPWLVAAWLNGDWNATPEGGIIKARWFRRYDIAPGFARIVQSWDTAQKAEQVNDPSACTTWGVTNAGDHYLIDVYVKRMEHPELKRAIQSKAEQYRPSAVLIEDKGSGTSALQDLRAETSLPLIAIEPENSKVMRAVAVSPTFEAGRVYLPNVAGWLTDYENELTIFPLAAHDDQVDSTTQYLKWAADNDAVFGFEPIGAKRYPRN